MPRLDMDTGAVDSPAGRLSEIGGDLGSLSRSISAQAKAAGGASEQAAVARGCQVFAAALQGALDACGDEVGLLGRSVSQAKVQYEGSDRYAVTVLEIPAVPTIEEVRR